MRSQAVLCVVCLCLSLPGIVHADDASGAAARPNLLANGGFEEWGTLDANTAQREDVRNVDLVPPGTAPVGWIPSRELTRDQTRTATITMDEETKHSGARSVRIDNRDMKDIALVQYSTERYAADPDDPHNLRPNRRYKVRWWVKGENVEPSGTGPIMMMFYQSQKDGEWSRTNAYERDPRPNGTFDWEQRQFTFVTDEHAKWGAFTFQLRWTTGTLWYDDVELVDLGPVVHVETY